LRWCGDPQLSETIPELAPRLAVDSNPTFLSVF
jgi:hypothetical protein